MNQTTQNPATDPQDNAMSETSQTLKETRAELCAALDRLSEIDAEIQQSEAHIRDMDASAQSDRAERQDHVRQARSARTREIRKSVASDREKRMTINDTREQISWLTPELNQARLDVSDARDAFEAARSEFRAESRINAFDAAWQAVLSTPEGQALAAVWPARRDELEVERKGAPLYHEDLTTTDGRRRAREHAEMYAGRLLGGLLDTAAAESDGLDAAAGPLAETPPRHPRELSRSEAKSPLMRRRLLQQVDSDRVRLISG